MEFDGLNSEVDIYVDQNFYGTVPFDFSSINNNERAVIFSIVLLNRSEKDSIGYFDNLKIGLLP
jgi:hypothetical protein